MSEKNRKPGFTYMFSNQLHQEVAISQKTGDAYCEDGTKYSAKEIELLKKTYGKIPENVHFLKKHFDGVIVHAENKKTE